MKIKEAIHGRLTDLIAGFDPSQSLEEVLEAWDKAMWGLWLDLIQADYTAEMLCDYAETHAWVEEPKGRWADQPRFAARANVAFYSLRNCFYQALVNTDCDLARYVRKAGPVGESKTQRKKRLKRTARLERELQDLKDRRDECQAMIATLKAASTNPWGTDA
jgi:hypothetical protein